MLKTVSLVRTSCLKHIGEQFLAFHSHQIDYQEFRVTKMKMATVFIYKSTLLVFEVEVDDRCVFREKVQALET